MSGANLLVLDSAAIIDRLRLRLDHRPACLAFDADGTLWTGDVSDDVFLSACQEGWLLDAAKPALLPIARAAGLSTSGAVSQLAFDLFESQKRGAITEVDLYAFMAWCYTGRSLGELSAYAAKILTQRGIDDRIRPEVLQIVKWARSQGITCYVVSASPTPIVSWAAGKWGFEPDTVIGATPKTRNEIIVPELADEVPFGANKCKLLKRRTASIHWLASFGDSEFDFELLAGAECAIAVNPKPRLLARLRPLSHAIVLQTQP